MSEAKTIENGGPAFPHSLRDQAEGERRAFDGMTVRDYFAAKAMQAILPNPKMVNGEPPWDAAARLAYICADAMLKARES